MAIKSFLKLVEIQTKVASVLPFILGTMYAVFRFDNFRIWAFLFMLASLICIDMATTAINNYMDYKKAIKKHGFGYESHNAIVRDKLQEKYVLATIIVLLVLAAVFGILLVCITDYLVLIIGVISLAAGILYSTGPVPISRTPFGEIFSGGFMGLIIPFLAAYIHVSGEEFLIYKINLESINLQLFWPELLFLLLISWPVAAGIANIMLANNICDLDDDVVNKRYTLTYFIGKSKAITLFRILYYSGYAAILLLLIFRVLSWPAVLFFVTIIPVEKHIRLFANKQSKQETFVLAVKNFVILSVFLIMTISISFILGVL